MPKGAGNEPVAFPESIRHSPRRLTGLSMLDFSNPLTWALSVLAIVLAGGAAYIAARSSNWLDAHASFLTAQQRKDIVEMENAAFEKAENYIVTWAHQQGQKIRPSVDDPLVRWGAQIALDHAGGMLADHGMSPEEAAARILAYLPPYEITQDTTGATVHASAPVTVQDLPAIQPKE